MRTLNLQKTNTEAWSILGAAVKDPKSPFRYLTLCTIADGDVPRARLLVLRDVVMRERRLEFHTDIRSPKWRELNANACVTVLGFDPGQRLQLRLEGTASLYGTECDENQIAWSALSPWTQRTYCGGPPGDPLATGDTGTTDTGTQDMSTQDMGNPKPSAPDSGGKTHARTDLGRERFGVIVFQATSLDWFQLERANNRRALFKYGDPGTEPAATWMMP